MSIGRRLSHRLRRSGDSRSFASLPNRASVKKHVSKSIFSRSGGAVHSLNIRPRPPRGGFSL
nr:MAG: hypothetical protein [Microvirus sp.]